MNVFKVPGRVNLIGPAVTWVQIFEYRGAPMGASNPHPHCQIWANLHPPNELAKEPDSLGSYYLDRGVVCSPAISRWS